MLVVVRHTFPPSSFAPRYLNELYLQPISKSEAFSTFPSILPRSSLRFYSHIHVSHFDEASHQLYRVFSSFSSPLRKSNYSQYIVKWVVKLKISRYQWRMPVGFYHLSIWVLICDPLCWEQLMHGKHNQFSHCKCFFLGSR